MPSEPTVKRAIAFFDGQELVIPPLEVAQPQKNAEQNIFPDSMFEKVESIGRRSL